MTVVISGIDEMEPVDTFIESDNKKIALSYYRTTHAVHTRMQTILALY